ncbi:MAG: class I SAM-dependent methyltransferase [Elusimicrobiota bacterium]
MASYVDVARCRVCGNPEMTQLMALGVQALTGVFPRSRDEKVTSGPLDLVKCLESPGGQSCGLVQLRQTYSKVEMYGGRYGYHSGLNASMVSHLRGKVADILKQVGLGAGDLVLDIGSNDCTLLKAYPESGASLVGVDPTGEQFRRFYPPHVELIADFFSADLFRRRFPGRKAKVVTSIAMFYDLDAPMDFVADVRDILSDDGIWVVEQSYLPAMLEASAYDTICHEHLEYYGARQMRWMMERSGLKIVGIERNAINGGSFSLTVAKKSAPYPECARELKAFLRAEEACAGLEPYRAFASAVARHREELVAFLSRARSEGKTTLGYGASTKGNVILQYCGLTEKDIPLIGEVNPDKFGSFTPGTRIPIVPEAEVRARKPDYLLALPWHFRDFIVEKEAGYLRAGGRLVFPLPKLQVVTQ